MAASGTATAVGAAHQYRVRTDLTGLRSLIETSSETFKLLWSYCATVGVFSLFGSARSRNRKSKTNSFHSSDLLDGQIVAKPLVCLSTGDSFMIST